MVTYWLKIASFSTRL